MDQLSSQQQSASHTPNEEEAHRPCILIADDDMYIRRLVEFSLQAHGYQVISANNGFELLQLAQSHTPDLMLIDMMMPQVDGYEAIRQMRNDTRISHIPMIILTALSRSEDIVTGFESGADDYITKPFNLGELLARISSHLRREARRVSINPLTKLPGNSLLAQELQERLDRQEPLALLHIDLDNFKAFNDTYGFARGDRVILLLAQVLRETVAQCVNGQTFIAHIGGDDFAALTDPDNVEDLCRRIITTFDQQVGQLYDAEHHSRGFLSGIDRYGILRRFRIMSLSIGVATNRPRAFSDPDEISRVAAEMKHYVKLNREITEGFAIDQRIVQQLVPQERRAQSMRHVLVLSEDTSLRLILAESLRDAGFIPLMSNVVPSLEEALFQQVAVILADADLSTALWDLCASQSIPAAVLVHDEPGLRAAHAANVTKCLWQPLPLSRIIECVTQLAQTYNDEEPSFLSDELLKDRFTSS